MRKVCLGLALVMLVFLLPSTGFGAEESFTLMIYLCGTDLETDGGAATDDLLEMAAAGIDADGPVKVIVETGGTHAWWLENIDPQANERWIVDDETVYFLQGTDQADMGDKDTLAAFVDYCVQAYPADRYGLVLWDHGGGSTTGVCFDEITGNYLTTQDIHDALAETVTRHPGFHLDLIAFDACLMASFEMANYVAPYADYMVASEELAPGGGFDYAAFLTALADDPSIAIPELGQVIADSFLQSNLHLDPDDYMTLSVLDLSQMPALTDALGALASDLSLALDAGDLRTLSRSRQNMRSLGDFNDAGSDMVDLRQFIETYAQAAGADAFAALRALEAVVLYNRYTEDNLEGISGLSILLPLKTKADYPYYSADYDPLSLFAQYSTFVDGYATLINGGHYVFSPVQPAEASGWDMLFALGEDITFTGSGGSLAAIIARIEEEGETDADIFAYSLTLPDEDMAYLAYVEGNLMLDISDEETEAYVDLGYLQNTLIDWENNTVYSLFDGTWPVLEGQVVHMTDQIITEKTRRSLIDVRVNDLDVYLLVIFDEARPQGEIIGYTEGYNEHGVPVRGYQTLQPGDIITPQYYLYVYDEEGEETIEAFLGDPIEYTGALAFSYETLEGENLDFAYTFCLNDIFGDYSFTDFLFFSY